MNSIKVNNPTDTQVSVNYKGKIEVIGAREVKSFPADVAKHWITIYQFMYLEGNSYDEETKEDDVKEADGGNDEGKEKEVTKEKEVKKVKKVIKK